MKIKYTGEPPSLCMGVLTVAINGREYDFGSCCLESGGCTGFKNEDSYIRTGPWTITKFHPDFPEDRKIELLGLVNEEIPYGCCGGCL